MKRIIIVCIFFIVVLFGGCGLVKVCVEKPSDIANAPLRRMFSVAADL